MDKTSKRFLSIAIPVVIALTAIIWITDPSPARWQSSHTSTEVGGPEPETLYPRLYDPPNEGGETRPEYYRIAKMDLRGLGQRLEEHGRHLPAGKKDNGYQLILELDYEREKILLLEIREKGSSPPYWERMAIDFDGSYPADTEDYWERIFEKARDHVLTNYPLKKTEDVPECGRPPCIKRP